jgi:hypothetical protein
MKFIKIALMALVCMALPLMASQKSAKSLAARKMAASSKSRAQRCTLLEQSADFDIFLYPMSETTKYSVLKNPQQMIGKRISCNGKTFKVVRLNGQQAKYKQTPSGSVNAVRAMAWECTSDESDKGWFSNTAHHLELVWIVKNIKVVNGKPQTTGKSRKMCQAYFLNVQVPTLLGKTLKYGSYLGVAAAAAYGINWLINR